MKDLSPILIVSATRFETAPLRDAVAKTHEVLPTATGEGWQCPATGRTVVFFPAGVGVPETLLSMAQLTPDFRPGLVMQVGIAGSFDRGLALGQVVEVVTERYADLGADDRDGRFLDLYALGLDDPDRFPFSGGLLINPKPLGIGGMQQVSGLTTNTASGRADRIDALSERCRAHVESMEGAALFDFCLRRGWAFAQLRGISNYVEPRDRSQWQIGPAIENLCETVAAWLNAV